MVSDIGVVRTRGSDSTVSLILAADILIVAEGVSMLVTNRSQFESIVAQRGIPGLLEELTPGHQAAS